MIFVVCSVYHVVWYIMWCVMCHWIFFIVIHCTDTIYNIDFLGILGDYVTMVNNFKYSTMTQCDSCLMEKMWVYLVVWSDIFYVTSLFLLPLPSIMLTIKLCTCYFVCYSWGGYCVNDELIQTKWYRLTQKVPQPHWIWMRTIKLTASWHRWGDLSKFGGVT